jgi:hypothetical protein
LAWNGVAKSSVGELSRGFRALESFSFELKHRRILTGRHFLTGGSPIQYRGPGPSRAARSPGLERWHLSSDRHPQPMHSVRPAFRRSSSAIRPSMRDFQTLERRAQSRPVGTRCGGSFASSVAISSRDIPTR